MSEEGMMSRVGLGLLGAKGDILGAIEQHNAANGNGGEPVSPDKPILFGDASGSTAQEKVSFGGHELGALEPGKDIKLEEVKTEEMEEEL